MPRVSPLVAKSVALYQLHVPLHHLANEVGGGSGGGDGRFGHGEQV